MNYFDLISELLPYAERISKAVGTVQRIMADPGVKDAIAVVGDVTAVVAKHQQKGTENETKPTGPGSNAGGAID